MRLLIFCFCVFQFSVTFAWAACFDSPTWKEQPITQDFIDQLDQTDRTGRAHFGMLVLGGHSVEQRRNDLRRHLMSAALLHHKGDRRALRQELSKGTAAEIVQAIDVSKLNSLDKSRVTEILWLNGCTKEAMDLLESGALRWRSHAYLPVATSNAPLLFEIANAAQEHEGIHQEKLRALGNLILNPETAEQTLLDFSFYISSKMTNDARNDSIHLIGPIFAMHLLGVEGVDFERPSLPDNPSRADQSLYLEQWTDIAAWGNFLGACETVSEVTEDLLRLADQPTSINRSFLEASVVRCFAMADG